MNDENDKTEKPPVGTDNFEITLVGVNAPSAAAIAEDWAMNVPNTNPAVEKIPDVWEMPPVFRTSGGRKLDKANRKTSSSNLPPVEMQTSETVAPPNLDIQPPPFISEAVAAHEAVAETPEKTNSSSSKLILLIIGLVALALVAAAFLAGIYFWFFYTPAA